jgi:hypothetical protein
MKKEEKKPNHTSGAVGLNMVEPTGEQAKTVDNCFCAAKSTKQGKMKEIYDFRTF